MKLERSLTALALAGVLVLSGCGDGDEDNGADFLADMRAGIESFTSAHMTMEVASPSGDMSGEGDMELSGDKLAMAMTMSMPALGDGEAEVRLVDGFMYMKMPGQTGAKFIKLDLSDPSGPLASLGSLTDAFDPSRSFDMFAEGLTKVVNLGEDDLDGETLDHYRLTIDTSKVEAFKGLPGASNLPETLDYEMWVDDEFQMRGMDMDLPTGKTTVRYTDLGEPVDIKAPPASQVTTMPGM